MNRSPVNRSPMNRSSMVGLEEGVRAPTSNYAVVFVVILIIYG
jgi:hypothetical protein